MTDAATGEKVGAPKANAPVGGAFLTRRQDAAEVLTPEAFDSELRLFGTTASQFVEREIGPVFEQLEGLDYQLSRDLMAKAGELGLLGVEVEEEYGGLGLGKAAAAVVTEKIAASGSFNVTFNAHSGIGTLPLVYFGTPEQKERYLPKLVTGEWVAAYCLTEPGSGSDSLAAKSRAIRDGDEWVLNGTKMWISNAGFADLFTVFAQVDGDKFSAFLVEAGTPGLSLGAEEKKMGIKGSSTRMVILEDVRVPVGNLLGEVGKGHHIAFGILNIGRFKLAAGAVGGCKDLIGLAQGYAKERRQFGSPIAEFGLIKEKVGWMAAETYALESAIYRLAGAMDAVSAGRVTQAEQMQAINEYSVEYSFIKVFGSEVLDRVVDEALQIYGGYGFSADYPIELHYRNSRINRIFEGTNEINRALTVDQLMKRAMRGQVDLLGPAQAAMQGRPVGDAGGVAGLQDAEVALANLKLATLQVAGFGAMAYMQRLATEQELVARVADMIGLVYLAESGLLRAERAVGSQHAEATAAMARLYTFAAVDKARELAAEALRRIPNGRAGKPLTDAYLADHGVDLIALRRQVAEQVYQADGYQLR
ncbi:MAG: acyl-CoA dehydrogenase family protein [Trueperaceae bacterium]|nr:acyl-CoA dehydrogenase family protein [Trueperaceae bacterium]